MTWSWIMHAFIWSRDLSNIDIVPFRSTRPSQWLQLPSSTLGQLAQSVWAVKFGKPKTDWAPFQDHSNIKQIKDLISHQFSSLMRFSIPLPSPSINHNRAWEKQVLCDLITDERWSSYSASYRLLLWDGFIFHLVEEESDSLYAIYPLCSSVG